MRSFPETDHVTCGPAFWVQALHHFCSSHRFKADVTQEILGQFLLCILYKYKYLKGTVSEILSKDGNVRFTTIPLKALSD